MTDPSTRIFSAVSGSITLASLLAAFIACGKSLVDSDFEGDAVFHAELAVSGINGVKASEFEHPVYAVFWMLGGLHGSVCDLVEHPGSSRPVGSAADGFTLFSVPTSDLLAESPSGAAYGFGRLMPYDDLNNNGKLDGKERFIGDSFRPVLYAPQALKADASPVGLPLSQGFHVSTGVPVPCQAPERSRGEDCGVELGVSCFGSGACGEGGICLPPDGGWENGYCVYPATHEGCQPEGASLYIENGPSGREPYWVKRCTQDKHCRTEEGYFCDQLLGACVPREPVQVILGRSAPDNLCSIWSVPGSPGITTETSLDDAGGASIPPENEESMARDGGAPKPPAGDGGTNPFPRDGGNPGPGDNRPPDECVPPDPRCDGVQGGGEMPNDSAPDNPNPPADCVPPDPRCDGVQGGGEMPDESMPPPDDGAEPNPPAPDESDDAESADTCEPPDPRCDGVSGGEMNPSDEDAGTGAEVHQDEDGMCLPPS